MNIILGIRHQLFGFIYNIFSFINKFSVHQLNKILIYDPNFDKFDNAGALFDYLIEKGYNGKYKIIYICRNYKELSKNHIDNVIFDRSFMGVYYFLTSKYVFYRAAYIRMKPASGQHVIQMWHGSPCKGGQPGECRTDGWINPYYTGFLSASKHFDPIYSKVFSVPENKMILCGHPRTDDLFKPSPNYNFGNYNKLIIWTPTFRKYWKQKYGIGTQLKNEDNFLPIITINDFEAVNNHLRDIGVKVVIKLHPSQNLDHYNIVEMDHLLLMSNDDFRRKGMDLYRFMAQCDAMITDYSSIYWDFLVLDRPIAFTEDDVDDYATGRGFIMDNPEKYKPGPKLFTIDDFYNFVDDVANNVDEYKKQRKEMNEYGNPVTDGNSCKRVLDSVGIKLKD